MVGEAQTSSGRVLTFGSFRLDLLQRVLQEGERPIRLGSRALEILVVLVERAGELVSKDEIMAQVWPKMVTEEATLRVHLVALRKALGHGQNGARYIENVTGRGYRFVAPVTRQDDDRLAPAATPAAAADHRYGLPALLTRIVGRSEIVRTLTARLPQQRLVTITGPGGVGKTTVALATASKLARSYAHGACFVDLAAVTAPRLVSSTLACALGLEVLSGDPVPALLAFLEGKQLLIVLDNCEHVIEAAATLTETLLSGAPGVHILATSREPLRSAGEWRHRLQPLDIPQPTATVTAAEALAFPAVELFAERAMASLDSFELSDANAAIVAAICRRLDGLPLAIEFAAARVDLFGLRELAVQLDDCLELLTNGRRTAAARHQTLRATLDWSYGLLSGTEQAILRRIAVFPAGFDLASASAVSAGEDVGAAEILDGICNLTAKSLIAADVSGEHILFHLLDTTRVYALEQLDAHGESARARRQHAALCGAEWEAVDVHAPSPADWVATYGRKVDDVRAALDWCFSLDGDTSIGVRLTAASAPLWFQLSLMDEYRRRLERALESFKAAPVSNAALEMQLNATLGSALIHTNGATPAMTTAWSRALELADLLEDGRTRWLALWGMGMAQVGGGNYASAVDFSERSRRASLDLDVSAATTSDALMAFTNHFAGNQATARFYGERVLSRSIRTNLALNDSPHRMDGGAKARAILCRILWVQGFPDQAVRTANDSVRDGMSADHALSACYALLSACNTLLWTGDAPAADGLTAMLLDRSARHSLTYWHVWGRCFDAVLKLRHGDRAENLERCRALLRDPLLGALHLETLGTLSEELAGAEAIARAETGRAGWCAPELLRAKGEIILKDGASDAAALAEALFRRSLDMARLQDALSWELRSATSLARLWRDRGRMREARDLLAPVYARFTEGFGTTDLTTARTLLNEVAT